MTTADILLPAAAHCTPQDKSFPFFFVQKLFNFMRLVNVFDGLPQILGTTSVDRPVPPSPIRAARKSGQTFGKDRTLDKTNEEVAAAEVNEAYGVSG